MIITREGDYALRIMRALSKGDMISIDAIAANEVIPKPFAYKTAKKLQRAGLISILRGAHGGCKLNCDLTKSTLHDLLVAVECIVMVNACMETGYDCQWREEKCEKCIINKNLQKAQNEITAVLSSYTLEKLLN